MYVFVVNSKNGRETGCKDQHNNRIALTSEMKYRNKKMEISKYFSFSLAMFSSPKNPLTCRRR